MADGTQKTQDSTTVRIWRKPKERLQNVVREKSAKEKREVTEMELASAAIEAYCTKEERKLGIN
jgi:uncharacterized hydantoinase/oxoprolinase family protein